MAMLQQSILVLVAATLAVLHFTGSAASLQSSPEFPPSSSQRSPPIGEILCNKGKADCDDLYKNGCETDIFSDPKNCGTCGALCEEKDGYVSVCNQGECGFACNAGYAGGDVKNCGACGVVCEEKPGYITSCIAGKCVYVDICTVTACPWNPNALTTCKAGNCTTTCGLGYADCNNHLPKDGCEVNVNADKHNCGACGVVCKERRGFFSSCKGGKCVYDDHCRTIRCASYTNAGTTCKEGTCITACSLGFADCNTNMEKDGCEVNLYSDNNNCGGCGKKCPKYSVCSKGICLNPV